MIFDLYSRPGCHLCDELAEELEPLIRGRADIRIVNIDGDLDLKKLYGLRIPVLAVEGCELSGYPLDVAAVEDYLGSVKA
jgi:hypothetical protein